MDGPSAFSPPPPIDQRVAHRAALFADMRGREANERSDKTAGLPFWTHEVRPQGEGHGRPESVHPRAQSARQTRAARTQGEGRGLPLNPAEDARS